MASKTLRVAAYQAPYLPFGSFDAVSFIEKQLDACETERVELLCCPEAVVGGLAHESDGQQPGDVALEVENGQLMDVLSPLTRTSVTLVVGFTERDPSGSLFNSAAVLVSGVLAAIYRKVFPGYRTVIQPGLELAVHQSGSARFGVMICNDIWYLEPARVLSARGAAVIFVPTNSGHVRPSSDAAALRVRGTTVPIARAVENTTTIVAADIAGSQGARRAIGCSRIVNPDGEVLAAAGPSEECLLIADVEARHRQFDPRGWDGHLNPAVTEAFVDLWQTQQSSSTTSRPASLTRR